MGRNRLKFGDPLDRFEFERTYLLNARCSLLVALRNLISHCRVDDYVFSLLPMVANLAAPEESATQAPHFHLT